MVWLWTRKTGIRWSWEKLSIANSGIETLNLVSGDLYLSKTGPWWLRQQASTGEGSYKRSHERCLSPVVQMSTLVQQIVKCISLHAILSWSELSQIPKKWDLWVILWYFSVFPYFHVLKVDGDANYQILLLGQSLPWKIMVHTITSKTQCVTRLFCEVFVLERNTHPSQNVNHNSKLEPQCGCHANLKWIGMYTTSLFIYYLEILFGQL